MTREPRRVSTSLMDWQRMERKPVCRGQRGPHDPEGGGGQRCSHDACRDRTHIRQHRWRGSSSAFYLPFGVAVDGRETCLSRTAANHAIRKIQLSNVSVTTLVGVTDQYGIVLGPLPARLSSPLAVAMRTPGSLFILDELCAFGLLNCWPLHDTVSRSTSVQRATSSSLHPVLTNGINANGSLPAFVVKEVTPKSSKRTDWGNCSPRSRGARLVRDVEGHPKTRNKVG